MRIIALDGASGTGKSVLIGRLQGYFESVRRDQVRVERLLTKELERDLDRIRRVDDIEEDMHSQFCDALIRSYREGYDRLLDEDATFQRNNNGELIFILDRYLLSLYAIQGIQWGIGNLYERCANIPKPDGQFIIRLAGKIRPEDMPFIDAARDWLSHDFHGNIWYIQNRLSNNQNYLDNSGYNAVKDNIIRFLGIHG